MFIMNVRTTQVTCVKSPEDGVDYVSKTGAHTQDDYILCRMNSRVCGVVRYDKRWIFIPLETR